MSNLRYIELCSNYRNRNQWHEPGEFEIPISQSGRKGATDAIDPVSLSAPFDSWPLGRFNVYSNSSSITLTIETTSIGTTSGTTILFVKGDTLNTLQIFKDYYAKCMITDIASSYKLRIETYDYLGVNKGKIVVLVVSTHSLLELLLKLTILQIFQILHHPIYMFQVPV